MNTMQFILYTLDVQQIKITLDCVLELGCVGLGGMHIWAGGERTHRTRSATDDKDGQCTQRLTLISDVIVRLFYLSILVST